MSDYNELKEKVKKSARKYNLINTILITANGFFLGLCFVIYMVSSSNVTITICLTLCLFFVFRSFKEAWTKPPLAPLDMAPPRILITINKEDGDVTVFPLPEAIKKAEDHNYYYTKIEY